MHKHHAGLNGILRTTSLTAIIILLSVITACGEPKVDSKHPDVATIKGTSGASASAKPADPNAGRPQLRFDTTDEERDDLHQPYYKCLKENGVPMETRPDGKLLDNNRGQAP